MFVFVWANYRPKPRPFLWACCPLSCLSHQTVSQSIHISVFSNMVQSVFVFYNLLSDACLSLFSLLCVSLCVVWLTAEGRPWCPHSFLFGTETSNGALMLAPRCHWAIFCHQTTTGSCHFYSFVLPMAMYQVLSNCNGMAKAIVIIALFVSISIFSVYFPCSRALTPGNCNQPCGQLSLHSNDISQVGCFKRGNVHIVPLKLVLKLNWTELKTLVNDHWWAQWAIVISKVGCSKRGDVPLKLAPNTNTCCWSSNSEQKTVEERVDHQLLLKFKKLHGRQEKFTEQRSCEAKRRRRRKGL